MVHTSLIDAPNYLMHTCINTLRYSHSYLFIHLCIHTSSPLYMYTGETTTAMVAVCGEARYNPKKEICCSAEVFELYERKTGTEGCCGWRLLDTAIEQCCHGRVIQKEDTCTESIWEPKPTGEEIPQVRNLFF